MEDKLKVSNESLLVPDDLKNVCMKVEECSGEQNSKVKKESLLLPDEEKNEYKYLPIKFLPREKYEEFDSLESSIEFGQTEHPVCPLCRKQIKNLPWKYGPINHPEFEKKLSRASASRVPYIWKVVDEHCEEQCHETFILEL